MFRGGGALHGGKRDNAGRQPFKAKTNWKQYKPIGKKENEKLKKEYGNMKMFVVPVKKASDNGSCNTKLADLIVRARESVFSEQNIYFYKNGCFADSNEKISPDNYTCAIDTIIAIGENMILNCSQDEKIENNNIRLMGKIKGSLHWRLTNDYNWKHSLRTPLWNDLAELFPTDFKPLGKIDAKIDNSVAELMTPVSVEFVAACDTCGCSLG